ncbi:SoxR reducing system RseC family protein [Alloalcanivorax mobilis]|uniref:SoxR reducing system RseC family protein n=1 Tax=Alloalcanivorax mobilis TaxID=2019569 RepID=UPI000C760E8D|nr:SoxR reducing system RseC family protein [Alloalcanivorax mobilis]
MIEEHGRVVAREPGAIWVETVRASTCSSCQARSGCGHRLINHASAGQRARLRVASERALTDFNEGDTVVVGIPEGALLRGALWVYGLPMALLFAGALLGSALPLPFDGAAAFGVAGLALGFLCNRWRATGAPRPADQPVVLGRSRAGESIIQIQ